VRVPLPPHYNECDYIHVTTFSDTSSKRISRSRIRRSISLLAAAGRGAWRAGIAMTVPGKGRERRKEEAMLRTAEDVTKLMGNMKGVTMKLGQVMSLMGGAVPADGA